MAGKIRGITIELTGDTKGLVKSLNDAKSAVKGVQSQLKDVNKVLKFDPKNTDLLRQKQDLLKRSVEETKNALEKQKQALKDMQNADNSDKTIDAQNALQREIAETEQKLKEAEQALKNFGSIGAQQIAVVGEKVKEVGQGIADVGDTMTKYVTTPIVAGFTYAGKSALDFGDSMAKVHTLVDDNTHSIEDLEAGLKDLSNESGRGPTELAEAMYQALSASVDAGHAVEFVGTATNLAKAGFLETSGAVDVLTTIMNAYGKSADEANYISDVLVQTQNDGKTTVNELAAQMGQVIPTAAAYNVGLENLTASYALMTKNGINTANSTTYLNGMLTELAREGSDVADILMNETGKTFGQLMNDGSSLGDVLQILYDSVGGNAEQFANLWGNVRAGRGALTLAQAGAEGFNEELEAMYNATGNVDTALEKLDTPAAQLRRTLNEMKNTALELGQSLITLLQPAFDAITQVVKSLSEWFTNLSPETQELIVKIGLIAAAIGPLLAIGGRLLIGLGQLMTFAPAIVGGIGSIGAVITGTLLPAIGSVIVAIGPIVAAIAAVIAIGVLLYKHWDEISAFAIETWGKLKDWLSKTLESIKTKFATIWENVKTKVSTTIDGIKTKITTVWNNIKSTISNTVNSIKSTISTVWDNIKSKVTNVVDGIKSTVSNVFNSIKATATSVWNGIKTAITNPIEAAKDKVSSVIKKIKGFFPVKIGNLLSGIKVPHISLNTGTKTILGKTITYPTGFSISWYKKAAEMGAIFSKEAIFGFQNGKYLGAGDANQPEMLIGKNTLLNMISGAVNNGMSSDAIYNAVMQGASNAKISVYIDGKDVTGIVNKHNTSQQLNRLRMQGV